MGKSIIEKLIESEAGEGDINIDNRFCPNCKSADTLIGPLGDQMVMEGKMPPNSSICATIIRDLIPPKPVLDRLPMGSAMYTYQIGLDICAKCYTVYATKIVIQKGKKMPAIIKPNLVVKGGGPRKQG